MNKSENKPMGKIQIGVIRKLAEEGPTKDGLHLAVNGLYDAGFVDADEQGVYSLTEAGRMVLFVYDDMVDGERELLMRMHRSHLNEQAFPASFDKTGHAALLIDMGFVRHAPGECLELTPLALEYWQHWQVFWAIHEKISAGVYSKKRVTAANSSRRPRKPIVSTGTVVESEHILDACDTCVNRRIVEMLAAKNPTVARLRDVLLEVERIEKELGL